MDSDSIDDAIASLERDRDRAREDVRLLRQRFDELSKKLSYPGTKFLIDLEYKQVYDATVAVNPSTTVVDPVPLETLPGLLHAVYVVSAYAPSSNTPLIITDGSIIVPPGNTFSVAIHRQRQTSPTRIVTSLVYYNFTGAPQDIAVRVWRRIGMGGAGS